MSFTVSIIHVFSIFAFNLYARKETYRDAREHDFSLDSLSAFKFTVLSSQRQIPRMRSY
jgi:hypothetical protein